MLKFALLGITPPGNAYFYDVGNLVLIHPTRVGLLQQIDAYYKANGKATPENIVQLIEDHMCRQLPGKFCVGDADGRPRKRVVTLKEIREVTTAFLSREGFADPGVAKDRAVLCATCPRNDRSACPTCTGLVAWGVRQVGGREVPGYGDVLGVCELDACLMSAGIFAKAFENIDGAPAACWRNKPC